MYKRLIPLRMKRTLWGVRERLGARPNPDLVALSRLKATLAKVPRYTPGRVSVGGWDLRYIDSAALVGNFETVVLKRWNDFHANTDSPVILDCGSNIGLTVLHYKRVYPKARITAFEPDVSACATLRANLAANGASDATIVAAAVWTSAGEAAFFSEGADGSRLVAPGGGDPVDLARSTPRADLYRVPTVRLADYLRGHAVDFLKLDIEGAESEVLADCAPYLDNVTSAVVECHLFTRKPEQMAVIMRTLAEAGFFVSLNSYGRWIDLIRRPNVPANEFDQYVLLSAWRGGPPIARESPSARH